MTSLRKHLTAGWWLLVGLTTPLSCGSPDRGVSQTAGAAGDDAGGTAGGSGTGGAGGASGADGLGAAAGGDGNVGAGGAYGLPKGCWNYGVDCNPLTNVPCNTGSGEGCGPYSKTSISLICVAHATQVPLAGACNDNDPPGLYCAPMLWCSWHAEQVCEEFCCTDAECGGKECIAFDSGNGTLGTCH